MTESKQFAPDAAVANEIASELDRSLLSFHDFSRFSASLRMYGEAAVKDNDLREVRLAMEEATRQPIDHEVANAFEIVQIARSYIYACLAFMYGTGKGGFADTKKAFVFYQLAANAGVGEAQCSLGEMYYYGVTGNILRNIRSAHVWFDCAMADEVSYIKSNSVNSSKMNWLKRKPMMYLKCKPPYQLHATKRLARMSIQEIHDISDNNSGRHFNGVWLLSVAAVGGCAEAQLWLASYFLVALDEFCDRRKALFWLRKSSKHNDTAKQVSQTVDVQTIKYLNYWHLTEFLKSQLLYSWVIIVSFCRY